jgi:hypothetical protein
MVCAAGQDRTRHRTGWDRTGQSSIEDTGYIWGRRDEIQSASVRMVDMMNFYDTTKCSSILNIIRNVVDRETGISDIMF